MKIQVSNKVVSVQMSRQEQMALREAIEKVATFVEISTDDESVLQMLGRIQDFMEKAL